MRSKMTKQVTRRAAWLPMMLLGWSIALAQGPAPKTGITRAPQALIDQHLDQQWLKANMLDMDSHWAAVVEPNGFINLNMGRRWKVWGTAARGERGRTVPADVRVCNRLRVQP